MDDAALDDRTLLARFVNDKSQDAFAMLVHRYVNLVYGVALRRVRDPHLADDVTQAVFLLLSQRARSILNSSAVLPGWLHRAATYSACNAIKMNARRQHHERVAATQRGARVDEASQVSFDLDSALSKLSDADRGALLLRYQSDQSVEQIATSLNLSAEATKKRLQRALQKLRTVLGRHGTMFSSIASVEAALLQSGPTTAPPQLTSAILANAPSTAAKLISQGTNTMFMFDQLKNAAMVAALLLVCFGGAGGIVAFTTHRAAPQNPVALSTSATAGTTAVTAITADVKFDKPSRLLVNDDGLKKDTCVDFDTGKLSDPGREFTDRADGAKWFRDTGADAHCETEEGKAGFYGMEMVINPIDNEKYDTIDAEQLRDEMKDATRGSVEMMSADGKLPKAYEFKTREGGIGVMQIVVIRRDENQHGTIGFRYKMIAK